MATKAHLEGNRRYLDKMDDIRIRVPKGKREAIRAHAQSKGLSVQSYIKKLISADMGGIPL
jgi:predicted DNA binding CopG/RHH family protein